MKLSVTLFVSSFLMVLAACSPAASEATPQPTAVETEEVDTATPTAEPTDAEASSTESTDTNTVPDAEIGINIGNLAPDFTTTTPDGEEIKLSDFRGNVVMINFWATWCGPCRVEMPDLQAQFDEHRDNGFVIVAVNNQEPVEPVVEFVAELGLTFPIAMDEQGRIQTRYGLLSYPSTFVVDRDGIIIGKHLGILTQGQIEEAVGAALGA